MPRPDLPAFKIDKRRKNLQEFSVDQEAWVKRHTHDATSGGLPEVHPGQKVYIEGIGKHDGKDLLIVRPEGSLPLYLKPEDLSPTPLWEPEPDQ